MDKNCSNRILTIPNILSLFRLCLTPLIIWLYCAKCDYLLTAAIVLLSGITDIIDGFIARHFNMTSELGKLLDPIADKVTQLCLLFCLLSRFPLMIIPLVFMVAKEIFMGITGWLVIRKTGKAFGANWHGKVNTVLLYAMMIMHIVWCDIPVLVSDISIAVCMIMMAVSLILYGAMNLRTLKSKEQK